MADYSEIFTLDEDGYDDGGFNDPLDTVDQREETEKKGENPDESNADIQPDGTDDQQSTEDVGSDDNDDNIGDTGEPETGEEPTEEPSKEPEPEPSQQAIIDKLVATIAKQSEQLATLQQMSTTERVQPREAIEEPLEEPQFSVEEWELDPKKCTEAVVEYREKIKEREDTAKAEEYAREQTVRQAELTQAHEIGWATVVKAMPELNTNEATPLRMRYAQHFEKYKNDPLGTIKAMHDLENDPVAATLHQKAAPAAAEPDTDLSAMAKEKERQKRVVNGTMHGRGKGGGQQKVSLTPQQESARRFMGVSKESYLETLKAMGMNEGGE